MRMKAQRGGGSIAAINLESRRLEGVGGQRHTSAAFPPGKNRKES